METNETPEAVGRTAPARNWKRSWLATGALAAGLAVGAAGIAGAATGSGASSSSTGNSSAASSAPAAPAAGQPPTGMPDPATMSHGPGETLLTGDNATKATSAALAAVPGATIVRVETDSHGGGVYEAHLKKSDGTYVTVAMDSSFKVTSTHQGFGPGPQGQRGPGGPPPQGAPAGAPAQGAATSN